MAATKRTIVRAIKIAARASALVAPGLAARWLERLFLKPSRHPLRPHERDRLATAGRTDLAFDSSRRLPVYLWGTGPTVLLVHGWSGHGAQMGPIGDALVQAGYRVVAYDAPGHGAADGRLTGLPELALAVERVSWSIGPVHAIVAHSLGAAAVTIAVARGLSVDRLVYLSAPENPDPYLRKVAQYLGFGSSVARRAQARIERRFDFPFAAARGTTLAPGIDVPLLVFHDRADPVVPHDAGARLVAAWPGARLKTTDGLGHHRILRDRRVVEAAVAFIGAADAEGTVDGAEGRIATAG